jgi:hypothetical protein
MAKAHVDAMVLVFQVLGFLAGGAALTRILTASSSPRERFPVACVGLAAAIVAGVLFWDHVWQIGSGLPGSTRTASAVSSFAAQTAPDPSANNVFLGWARNEMRTVTAHGNDTYYLEPATVLKEPELGQWSTYELLPGRATSTPSEANWIIFYGVPTTLTAKQRRTFNRIFRFSPDYALALRSNAH